MLTLTEKLDLENVSGTRNASNFRIQNHSERITDIYNFKTDVIFQINNQKSQAEVHETS